MTVPPEAVRTQLEKIVSSALFSRAARLKRFLEFVVDRTLRGEANRIKEYSIGTEVFGRSERFDPRLDPIVRLQAARLRSRLAEYYAGEGKGDLVRIEMPRGGYVPSFAPAPVSAGPPIASIAVLPFVNIGPHREDEYFSDGLTEELINSLACVSGLRVVSRTSVWAFKNQAQDAREIGARLQVSLILEGSVRRSRDHVRVTAQLIDVQTGYHLLSRAFNRSLEDVFAIQEEIADAVVREIADQLGFAVVCPATRRKPARIEAYDFYLRGRFALASGVGESLSRCVDLFRRALEIDPNYAPACAGLADTYVHLAWWSAMPTEEAMPKAKEAACCSVGLDESLADAHGSLATVACLHEWDWAMGEREFRRALELQPGSSHTHWAFAQLCLLALGRVEEAIEHLETSVRLSPLDLMMRATATYALGLAGRFDEAQAHHREAVRLDPTYATAHLTMGLVQRMAGRLEEGVAALEKAVQFSHGLSLPLGALGHARASAGDLPGAKRILEKLERLEGSRDFELATVYSGLSQREKTLDTLERAVERRSIHLVLLPIDFHFAWLAGDARFKGLLGRMGLSHAGVSAPPERRRPARRRRRAS